MKLAGIYSVPVAAELERFASFAISDISFCTRDASTRLSYELPELLVGQHQKLSFEGAYDPALGAFPLTGSNGTATCAPEEAVWTCQEVLTGVETNTEDLARRFEDMPADEAASRSAVAEIFATDPIGILSIDAPK